MIIPILDAIKMDILNFSIEIIDIRRPDIAQGNLRLMVLGQVLNTYPDLPDEPPEGIVCAIFVDSGLIGFLSLDSLVTGGHNDISVDPYVFLPGHVECIQPILDALDGLTVTTDSDDIMLHIK